MAAATDTASADADFLAEVSREFVRTLPSKLEDVVSLWTALADGAATPEQSQALYRNVHSLAGSAKTFGCAPVSAAARTLEYQLKPVVARPGALAPDERSRLQSLVEALLASAPAG
ncbi:MAG: Hpt domain-containing protein [Betaproteobacteria bacterium]